MRNVIKKINETGTLLVEALAMLGLISMVTPVLYKKASERTVELQDINASSQLRALSTAMDSYLKDKFADISRGETVNGIDYGSFKDNESASKTIEADEIANVLKDYLPYGFLDNDGNLRETKLFGNYSIIIKSESELKDGKAVNQTLTSFIVIPPKNDEDFSEKRAARVASMVGSNGGYVTKEPGGDNLYAMGAQGIWKVPVSELGNPTQKTMVISSLQPISSQGLANEDVLHRHDEPDADDELNSMETDLFLGYGNNQPHNIRMVNQIIMTPVAEGMVEFDAFGNGRPANNASATTHKDGVGKGYGDAGTTSLDNALYIGNKGGAYLEGVLKAMDDHFTVTADGIKYFNDRTDAPAGEDPKYSDATFSVTADNLIYGNPGNGNAKLKVTSNTFSFGKDGYTPEGGEPVAAKRLIYADDDMVDLGDGYLSVHNDGSKWNTVVGGGDIWNGTVTQYIWNGGTPDGGTDDVNHNYELSVNGSAYVRDTILTAKLKTFDVDAATLRAGVPHEDFNTAEDDNFFFKVRSELDGADQAGALMVGASDAPMITVANSNNNPYNLPTGVVVHTEDVTGNGGINIVSGGGMVPTYEMDPDSHIYKATDSEDVYNTQEGTVKISGIEGVYIDALDEDGSLSDAPVSLQKNTFSVYKDGNYKTVNAFAHRFNILSEWLGEYVENYGFDGVNLDYYRHGYNPSNWGRAFIADSNFIIADTDGHPYVDIMPSTVNGEPTSRFAGGFSVYDSYNDIIGADNASGNDTQNPTGEDAAFLVRKNVFEVRTTTSNADTGETKGDKILVVDNNGQITNANRGSVYIRRGGINVDTSGADRERLFNEEIRSNYRDPMNAKGYVAADRFVAHYGNPGHLTNLLETSGGSSTSRPLVTYEGYEVNPAYTSVMHDIKLTTRGGARLSDILPDFINKGIYVVDTTYAPTHTSTGVTIFDWQNGSDMEPDEIGPDEEAGEYLGFVPTPKCPPGYAKVITLTPAGWAMAQAGIPAPRLDGKPGNDVYQFTDINAYTDAVAAGDDVSSLVLRFQKSTWLKSLVRPYCDGQFKEDCSDKNTFQGWGAVMGFIYPAYPFGGGANEIYWNVFPVYHKELEGYATVYCYFDRSGFDSEFVYTGYDQLNQVGTSHLNSWDKNSDNNADDLRYLQRLDDPALKYQSPW